MNEEASWNPASGCFQCPISMKNLGQSWVGINPLPGLAYPGRGYFSVPLNVWYIPLPLSDIFGDFAYAAMGEVDNAHLGKFGAIVNHEKCHIDSSGYPVKGLLRLAASKGHQAVFDIISTNSAKAWEDLQYWNAIIAKLTNSINFIEELSTTLLGCAEFREKQSELHYRVESDRIEEKFVQAQSELFGSDFEEIYRQLDEMIYRKFGVIPLAILSRYSMDWLEVGFFGKAADISYEKLTEETAKARLDRCLYIFNSIPLPPEAQHWPEDHWWDFFARGLVDFRRWRGGRQDLLQFLKGVFDLCQDWWAERGFHRLDNPATIAVWMSQAPHETYIFPIDRQPPADTDDPEEQQRKHNTNERVRLAREQNRTVIALTAPEHSASITFVPRFDEQKQGFIPYASLMMNEPPGALLEGASLAQRLNNEHSLRRGLSTFLFFEGLRMKAATGQGVCCPVRSMEWGERFIARISGNKLPPCCGRSKELIAFWEAGKKATEQGWFQPYTWEPPRECM